MNKQASHLWIGLLVVLFGMVLRGQGAEPAVIDLKRKLVSVDIERPTWPKALNVFLSRLGIPFLLELDKLSYRTGSIFHGKTEDEVRTLSKRCGVHLKNVTVEEVIQYLLKDEPNYNYELVDKVVLHIYPKQIPKLKTWPLNAVQSFAVSEGEISKNWYRTEFEALVDPMRIDLGNITGSTFAKCLSPRSFHRRTLRQILLELSKSCRVQWVFEPLPPEEIRFRVSDWGDEFYPQGKRIQDRGGDWYQLQCLPPSEDNTNNGVLR